MKKYILLFSCIVLVIIATIGVIKYLPAWKAEREEAEKSRIEEENIKNYQKYQVDQAEALRLFEEAKEEARKNYREFYDRFMQAGVFHYTVTYKDGSFKEEIVDSVSYKIVSPEVELYCNEEWFLEIDKKNKTYIMQERFRSYDPNYQNAFFLHTGPAFTRIFKNYNDFKPTLKKRSESEFLLDETFLLFLDKEGLPEKITSPEFTIDFTTISKQDALEIVFPEPPLDYFVRVLTREDYTNINGDPAFYSLSWHMLDNEYAVKEGYVSSNYEGVIGGRQVHIYLQGVENTREGFMLVCFQGERPQIYKNVSLSDSSFMVFGPDTDFIFEGKLTENRLTGEWSDSIRQKERVELKKPFLSSNILFYTLYNLFDVPTCWDAKNVTGNINYEIEENHKKLLGMERYIMPEEEWRYFEGESSTGGTYIHCNESGILCMEMYKYIPKEVDDYRYYELHNQILLFDLICGTELRTRDVFLPDYMSILEEMGYDMGYKGEHRFIVYPTGVFWLDEYDERGATIFEGFFLDWEKVKPIIKPSGPLSPFPAKYVTQEE